MTKVNMNQMIQKTTGNNNQQSKTVQQNNRPTGPSFQDVLQKVKSQESVKFSKHATNRLNQRNIELTDADIKKIDSAMSKAAEKGIKDALIILDNKAFVANIKNNTIVTAATNEQLLENVFTNIDGAVIV